MTHRIWIELTPPSGNTELATEAVLFTNNMMARLRGVTPEEQAREDMPRFWYSADKNRYCYGDGGGYVELEDHGHYFNLTYFGRD